LDALKLQLENVKIEKMKIEVKYVEGKTRNEKNARDLDEKLQNLTNE